MPGDHFTVLEEHARTTALTVHHWLADPDRRRPGARHRSEGPDDPLLPGEAR
ncbi:hypothetical protein ABT382_38430 [Streptomyces pharetrae]|uniref:hypothetical protein n=1 Tax=Streptomyces pharetrae TaxID=291370 RepID=UPI00335B892F